MDSTCRPPSRPSAGAQSVCVLAQVNMCRVSRPVVKNLVVHFNVGRERVSLLSSTDGRIHEAPDRLRAHLRQPRRRGRRVRREATNFYVLGLAGRTYTVFPASGNVIATGIRDHSRVLPALHAFASLTGLDSSSECGRSARVVNGTYVGRVECVLPDVSACQALQRYKSDLLQTCRPQSASVTFRSEFFPGARVKWSGLGSVNLFNNGKYVLVGVKSSGVADRLHEQLCVLMRRHWTTSGRETRCAWTAAS